MARRGSFDTLSRSALPFGMNWQERAHLEYIQARIVLAVLRYEYVRYSRTFGQQPSVRDYRFIAASTKIRLREGGLGGCVWLLDQSMVIAQYDLIAATTWLNDVKLGRFEAPL